MNLLVKNLFLTLLLVFSIVFPNNSQAWGDKDKDKAKAKSASSAVMQQTGSGSAGISENQTLATFRVDFDKVVYSLQTFEEVLKDLERVDDSADKGISKKAYLDMKARLTAGFELMGHLIQDVDLENEEWVDKTNRLAGALDNIFFGIVRYHGEDRFNREQGQVPRYRFLTGWFKELFFDVKNIFIPKTDINGEFVFGPMERWRRNTLTVEYIKMLDGYINNSLSKMDSTDAQRIGHLETYQQTANMGIDIRKSRWSAQISATSVYFVLAAWGFFQPMYDAVGGFVGRSEMSLDFSADIYGAMWATIAIAKWASTSTTVLANLRVLLESAKDPKEYGMVAATEQPKGIHERLTSLFKDMNLSKKGRGFKCYELNLSAI